MTVQITSSRRQPFLLLQDEDMPHGRIWLALFLNPRFFEEYLIPTCISSVYIVQYYNLFYLKHSHLSSYFFTLQCLAILYSCLVYFDNPNFSIITLNLGSERRLS